MSVSSLAKGEKERRFVERRVAQVGHVTRKPSGSPPAKTTFQSPPKPVPPCRAAMARAAAIVVVS